MVNQVKTKDHAQISGRGAKKANPDENSQTSKIFTVRSSTKQGKECSGLSPNSSSASRAFSHLRQSPPLPELCFPHQEKPGGWTR